MSELPSPESSSAEMALFAISQDSGPFYKMGSQFGVPGGQWLGPVIASPTAIYMVKNAKNSHSYGGGLVGVMLSAALTKNESASTCNVEDLPLVIRQQVDPKGKGKVDSKPVLIVPKATVSYVKSGFNTSIVFTVGIDKFTAYTGIFSTGKSRRMLQSMGWQINTPLTPTAAPAHDMRSEEERKTGEKSLAFRVLMVVGAIVIIILVIAARVAADLH